MSFKAKTRTGGVKEPSAFSKALVVLPCWFLEDILASAPVKLAAQAKIVGVGKNEYDFFHYT